MHHCIENPTETSVQGARDVKHRRTSQAMRLLAEYKKGDLTDEEAAVRSGIAALPKACYWKRCSDLRSAGYIVLLEPRGSVLLDHP
jgi:hypothetical protein